MKRKSESAAQPAHPADRFAREIVGMLERNTTRSRRLMREALDGAFCHRDMLQLPYQRSTCKRSWYRFKT
ncbi:MAG: hypothetical protein IPP13_03510 [Kouleothrix sp.]|jgi:hypothetical protein|nr:hypothetical protein [Kouleothrix sp.]